MKIIKLENLLITSTLENRINYIIHVTDCVHSGKYNAIEALLMVIFALCKIVSMVTKIRWIYFKTITTAVVLAKRDLAFFPLVPTSHKGWVVGTKWHSLKYLWTLPEKKNFRKLVDYYLMIFIWWKSFSWVLKRT